MQISELGDGLNILIVCEATGADNFLAFSSWYSFTKNLPDARVSIACRRPTAAPKLAVLPWVYKVDVPFFYYSGIPETNEYEKRQYAAAVADRLGKLHYPIMTVPSEVMCLSPLDGTTMDAIRSCDRFLDGEKFCLSAKSPDAGVFCSLREGCGSFVPAKWIDKGGHPFGKTDLLMKGDLTVNERRVFSLWKKLCPLYDTIV